MSSSKSAKSKAAWAKARRYAKANDISISEARSLLAREAVSGSRSKTAPTQSKAMRSVTRLTKNKELLVAEQELQAKYPHIVEGTLRVEDHGPHKGRRSVEIACQTDGCKQRRRIHTSDAFQTKLCVQCTAIRRKERRTKAGKKGVT